MSEGPDFECPFCGQAQRIVRDLLADIGDIQHVWRHFPLENVHPHTQVAAEAATSQWAVRTMYDLLPGHQGALLTSDLMGYAERLGFDVARFTTDRHRHVGATRVARDVDSADLSEVSGTPTFLPERV